MISSNTPPEFWDKQCIELKNVFLHSHWHAVLKQAFDTNTIYLWDNRQNDGISITIFEKTIFKIGYLGFPIGGTLSGNPLNKHLLNSIISHISPSLIQILRIPSGAYTPTSIAHDSKTLCPETHISNLANWDINNLSKHCRRDINKSIRENGNIKEIINPSYSNSIYNLYKGALKKNKGSLRYNEKYFRTIIQAAISNKNIRITCLKSNNQIVAFLIVILSSNIAYYLHGAIDYSFRKSMPNDFLIYDAIQWAKANNALAFNLMCSPQKQTSLIKYKEKWGGNTSQNTTFEFYLSPTYSTLFKFANTSYNVLRKIAP